MQGLDLSPSCLQELPLISYLEETWQYGDDAYHKIFSK